MGFAYGPAGRVMEIDEEGNVIGQLRGEVAGGEFVKYEPGEPPERTTWGGPPPSSLYKSGVQGIPSFEKVSTLIKHGVIPTAPTQAYAPGESPKGTSGLGEVAAAGTLTTTLAKLGGVGVAVAAAYGISKVIGMVYPWESAEGEGFIAPWTPKMRDENGKWVSAVTRPDLFGGEALPLGSINGVTVVKSWLAGGWPFSLTSDGRIHTVTKNGIQKSWKPKRPIVLVAGSMNLNTSIRAQRLLDRQWRRIAKRVKQLKLA